MTTRKITLSLPDSLVEAAEAAVAAGRARSISAYIAAVAGAGEARLSLAEVMRRWELDSGSVAPGKVTLAEQWAADLMARNDQRHTERQDRRAGHAA